MLKIQKPSKKIFIFLSLFILGVGIALTLYQLQQQQRLKQFAAQATQSATAACSPESNTGTITVSFANTDDTKDVNVTAKDLQTGSILDLGTITHSASKSGTIVTDKASLDAGNVVFTITWTDGTPGTDTITASYTAVGPCNQTTVPVPACIENQAFCRWDPLDGAVSYTVVVKDNTNTIIKTETLPQTASQSAFLMEPDKTYTCTVTPQNACGTGSDATATQKSCITPTPTPTATPSATPTIPVTDTPTPTTEQSPTPTETPGPQVTPTNTPSPTPTSTPGPTSPTTPTNTQPPQFFPSNTPPPGVTVVAVANAQNNVQPTIAPTGNASPTAIIAIVSVALSILGLFLFFAL